MSFRGAGRWTFFSLLLVAASQNVRICRCSVFYVIVHLIYLGFVLIVGHNKQAEVVKLCSIHQTNNSNYLQPRS